MAPPINVNVTVFLVSLSLSFLSEYLAAAPCGALARWTRAGEVITMSAFLSIWTPVEYSRLVIGVIVIHRLFRISGALLAMLLNWILAKAVGHMYRSGRDDVTVGRAVIFGLRSLTDWSSSGGRKDYAKASDIPAK
jgi:hypothetical protein